MTDRDKFAKQCQLIDEIKELLENNQLFTLSLTQLENLHEAIEHEINTALEKKENG